MNSNKKSVLCFLLVISFVLTFVLIIPDLSGGIVRAETRNIALGKNVSASSSYNDVYTPDKIVDGDDGQDVGRWNSQQTRGLEWVIIDLGEEYEVAKIVLKWWAEVNLSDEACLKTSLDGNDYSVVLNWKASETLTDTLTLSEPVKARYLRFEFNLCHSDWGYSLFEIEAYEKDEREGILYKNLALFKPATASSVYNEIYTADKLTDGIETGDTCRWNSKATRGEEWIQIDLEHEYNIFRVDLLYWAGLNFAENVSLGFSLDGKVFTEVTSLHNVLKLETVILLDKPARTRYIRVSFGGCKSDWGYSINEIKAYSDDYVALPNIALDKNVYVSENSNGNGSLKIDSRYVNDGVLDTRWASYPQPVSSSGSDSLYEQWLTVDLGKIADVKGFSIYWYGEDYYAKNFSVLGSLDGVQFTKMADVEINEYSKISDISLMGIDQIRYIRFEFHTPGGDSGYSISELEIYGTLTEEKGNDLYTSEFEDALITGARTMVKNKNASGGYYVSGLNKNSTVECISDEESVHNITIRYFSDEDAALDVYINGGFASVINLPASGSLKDGSYEKGTVSHNIYIPSGSVVKFIPSKEIGLDCIEWNLSVSDDITNRFLKAEDGNSSSVTAVEGIPGADEGTLYKTVGKTTFSYSGLAARYHNDSEDSVINKVALKYLSEKGGKATLESGNGETVTVNLPASKTLKIVYANFKEKIGGTLRITLDDGISFDYAELLHSDRSKAVEVSFGDSKHSEISLDGIWDCTVGNYSDSVAPETFDNTIPVPGMWDLAENDLGSDDGKSLWYHRTVNLTEDIPAVKRVIIKINKAYYGRTVYVNGKSVGTYYYNFTASEMDITDYLKKGENDICIKLGTYKSGTSDPKNPAHMGRDQEKTSYLPGLVDSVSLIIRGGLYVDSVQVAPDIKNGNVRVVGTVYSPLNHELEGKAIIRIYELGVYDNGKPASDKLINTVEVSIGRGIDEIVDIPGFDKQKNAWSPDNPFLYRIEIETDYDVFERRFGMRTVSFDNKSGKLLLNGEEYFLRGTNICINRFYEDELRSDHPWDEQWVRTLFSEFKDVNWDGARFCIGFPPEFWYDICDEIGFLVVDEYPYWHCDDSCKAPDLAVEVGNWVTERQMHPCVLFWDIQNESDSDADKITREVIGHVIDIDIQKRPWENGWGRVYDFYSPYEYHIYNFIDTSMTLDDIGTSRFQITVYNTSKYNYLNEYGWIWVSRDGYPTLLSAAGYNKGNWGNTREERLDFYATALAQMTERFRISGKFFGIFQFCGLSYSKNDGTGYTSDVLSPDISNPEIRSELKEKLRSAFAPIGIVINDWNTGGKYNCARRIPVVIINDTGSDLSTDVTVTLYKGRKAIEENKISSVTKTMTAEAHSQSDKIEFTVEIPNEAGKYTVVASYKPDGEEPVFSARYLDLETDGEGSGIQPPVTSSTVDPEPEPPVTTDSSESEPQEKPAKKSNVLIPAIICGTAVLIAAAAAAVVIIKKKKSKK